MDRFTRGFAAGAAAAFVEFIIGYILYFFNYTELLWLNFASVLVYGREPLLFGEKVFSELIVLFFSGLMGAVFALLISMIGSRNYLFKGLVFGETVWFSAFAITILFNLPEFRIITFKTSVSNFVLAAVYGILTAEILRRLDKALLKE